MTGEKPPADGEKTTIDGGTSAVEGPPSAIDGAALTTADEANVGAVKRALRALAEGRAPHRRLRHETIRAGEVALEDVDRAAAFLDNGGLDRLRGAVGAATQSEEADLAAAGRRVLRTFEQFRAAARGKNVDVGRLPADVDRHPSDEDDSGSEGPDDGSDGAHVYSADDAGEDESRVGVHFRTGRATPIGGDCQWTPE